MEALDEPLQAIFASHVDTVYRALDLMYPAIHSAVELLCASMLDEHRVLVCGNGAGVAIGQAFCATLLNRTRIDRPALPVLGIGTEPATIGSIAESYGISEVHARQIRSLGQRGDALVAIAGPAEGAGMGHAVQAAHARGMRVIALTAGDGGEAAAALALGDIELRVPTEDPGRVSECQLLLLNALASLIERSLFGEG
jgi:phosphoheptose isomerase